MQHTWPWVWLYNIFGTLNTINSAQMHNLSLPIVHAIYVYVYIVHMSTCKYPSMDTALISLIVDSLTRNILLSGHLKYQISSNNLIIVRIATVAQDMKV